MKKLLLIPFLLLLLISCDPESKRIRNGGYLYEPNMYTMEPVKDTFYLGDTINFSINIPENFIKNTIDTLRGYGTIRVRNKSSEYITNYFIFENIGGKINLGNTPYIHTYIHMVKNNYFYSVKFRMILKNNTNYSNENITGQLGFILPSAIDINPSNLNPNINDVGNVASFRSTFKHNNRYDVEFYVKDTVK